MLRPFTHFACFGLLSALLTRPSLAYPASFNDDPCIKVAGKTFVDPADALNCMKSFPFREDLRQNVISVVSGVFDFYTFELFYANSPAPFQESTADIRGKIARIHVTQYEVSAFPSPSKAPPTYGLFPSETDYDFNLDLYETTNQMNDGHTRTSCYCHVVLLTPLILLSGWLPDCYITYNNILPAPLVLIGDNVFIIPNSVEVLEQFGRGFTSYFEQENYFDWRRLAGAQVTEIGGLPALDYIDQIATTVSGNYLDHNVRVNSVVSSYRIVGSSYSQRLGDAASELFLKQTSLDMTLIPKGSASNTPETVTVPFVAGFMGNDFTDGPS
jgi:hypothetical protein